MPHSPLVNKRQLLQRLEKLYPNPRSELNFESPYQLLVAVLLSAQCTDKKVNEVTPLFFKSFPSFQALSRGALPKIETILRPINYYRTKSKNLLALSKMIGSEFSGEVPKSMEELISLPGIGRKTANVILGELGAAKTFPVDTHVLRVSHRLGLSGGEDPVSVEEELMREFQSKHWRNLHHWLILHGRRVCKATRPQCPDCVLADMCPSVIR